mmetsp:Transcript_27470/g.30592  ORF Transcript_27470/g.30592 Transcript_27470/m.30592 type:complete len:148 (-) Transcript_27470:48-491(-)
MKFFLCLALFLATVISVDPLKWEICDTGATFQANQVTMTPYPAVAGKPVTVHTDGYETKANTAGDWSTTVYLDGLPVTSYKGSICNPPIIPNCACPCAPGNHTTELTLNVPSFAITDSGYSGKFTAYDENKALILCIKYTFSIVNNG